jgi:hypothetical protein
MCACVPVCAYVCVHTCVFLIGKQSSKWRVWPGCGLCWKEKTSRAWKRVGKMTPLFLSVPQVIPNGRSLHLGPGKSGCLLPELCTCGQHAAHSSCGMFLFCLKNLSGARRGGTCLSSQHLGGWGRRIASSMPAQAAQWDFVSKNKNKTKHNPCGPLPATYVDMLGLQWGPLCNWNWAWPSVVWVKHFLMPKMKGSVLFDLCRMSSGKLAWPAMAKPAEQPSALKRAQSLKDWHVATFMCCDWPWVTKLSLFLHH